MLNSKTTWGGLLLLLLILLMVFSHKCKCSSEPYPADVRHDTVWLERHDSTGWYTPKIEAIQGGVIPKYETVQVWDTVLNRFVKSNIPQSGWRPLPSRAAHVIYLSGKTIHDTVSVSDYIPAEPEPRPGIAFYSDKVKVLYGTITIMDSVDGRILSRQVKSDLSVPTITNTVTLHPPKRTQLYAGMVAQGNALQPLAGIGPAVSVKTKSDHQLDAAVLLNRSGQLTYQAGFKFLISFRKR